MVAVGNIQRRDGGKQPLQFFAQGRAIHHPHRLLHIILHKIIHRGVFAHPSRKRQLHRRGATIGQEMGPVLASQVSTWRIRSASLAASVCSCCLITPFK